MFGNLFDEEGAGKGPQATQENTIDPPPAPRGPTKLAGIWNQGSTCFLNSAVQSLSFLPEFREAILRVPPQELGFSEEDKKKRRVIPIEMQKLFASLRLENQQAASTKMVTDSFGWGNTEVAQQQDVQELCTQLLPALDKSLKGTSGENLIRDVLHVKTVQKIRCESCGNTTENEGEESTLFMQVEGFPKGLEESLRHSYCNAELMTGDNKYRCDVCETHTDAQKMIKLRSLPPVLMLALNRFSTDHNWRPYKVTDNFPFPMELDMGAYTEGGQSDGDLTYELMAVIVHSGSCGGGHYTACIRDIDNVGHWEMRDDDTEDQSAQVVKADIVDCVSPKETVATVLSNLMKKSPVVSIDRLSAEIAKQTGVTWAKRHKRRCGSFPKFLSDNPDVFHVEGSLVTLAEKPKSSTSLETQAPHEPMDTASPTDNSSASPSPSSSHGSNRKKPQKPQYQPRPGHNWFFFNDARVAPILAEELKNEYSGKKSAYLLLYRLKKLQRPSEAEGNPAYGIPQHLVDEVNKKNEDLKTEREEYEKKEQAQREEEERKKSQVQVDIRYHFNYKVLNGMLTTDTGSLVETFQRSQTLGEVMSLIVMLGSGHLEEGKVHLHRMKCWEDKTHLYDELNDMNKTLQELSIENGTILFAWDGCQVDGHPIPTGAESEPLTLQLKQYCSPHTVTHSFPKNLTLREFITQVSKVLDIPETVLHLKFPEVAAAGDHGTKGDLETLESIHLTDKSCILFDGSNRMFSGASLSSPDHSMSELLPTADERFCIHIENRCDRESKESPVLEIEVEKDMTVGSVKELFMTMYSIQCDSAVLQEVHPIRGLQAPYDEEKTVGSVGITSSTSLVLDWSKMVFEFRLYPDPTPDQPNMQVTVNKNCTVQECFQAMATVAGLNDPAEWHVCTATFLFEPNHILDDWDLVLDTSCHFFVLEQGRLPPKGHISLPVWLYPSPLQLSDPQEALMNINDLLISDSKNASFSKPVFMGNTEIDKDAKLEALRHQIRELLAKSCHQASSSQLRLRMMEEKSKRLRRVLRDPSNTLRRLKLENKSPVGVEIVNHGAEPCKEEILLNVRVLNQKDGMYQVPQELLWDTRCGTSAAKLRQDIASRLMVPEEMLVIAKHFPAEFQWKILRDNVQAPAARGFGGRRGRKRGPGPKPNICHKPFCVEDGDVIGVICQINHIPAELLGMASVSVKADDFCTGEDHQGRKQLEEEKLRKQLERRGRGAINGLSLSVTRRPEVALKIQVQEYS